LESVCRLTPTVGSNPTLSAICLLDFVCSISFARFWFLQFVWPDLLGNFLMIVRTVEQVRRAFRVVAGFTLLLAGVVMIITPGPGWLVIFLGLSLLAAEFIWARRLMDRMKRQGERVREAVWPANAAKNVPAEPSAESNELK
jgi:hypothetical protein